jgi:hypothetical protein
MKSKDLKKIILDQLHSVLKIEDFRKSGNNFQSSNGELTYHINVQTSQSSTAEILKFTLNIEISSVLLHKLEDTSISLTDIRHFTKRIGYYFDPGKDTWWTVSTPKEAQFAADEILNILRVGVLPEFAKLQTTNDLAVLWKKTNHLD